MSEEHPVIGHSDPLIGSVLEGRYRIERRVGEGGMGAVYLARHIVLEKILALKILHAEYARRQELVERFLHEAKAASRIRHEHVIDITDFGVTADRNVFFAMEYLEGSDLATVLDREGPLPWLKVKSIALQLCAALQAAHEAGVIHRDLKPENIYLIDRQNHPDFVKVLDFGVAKLTEMEEGGRERRLTRTGMVFGTPEYMSPEQARGEKPDPRVDIYALGCIIFELLSGDVPFRGENFMGVLSKHLFDPAPLLSERTDRLDVPEGIQAVLTQAMAKDKNDRFGSMNELAVALDTLDATEGIAYSAPGTIAPEKSRKSLSRGISGGATPAAPRLSAGAAAVRGPSSLARSAAPAGRNGPGALLSSQPTQALSDTIDDEGETTLRKVKPRAPAAVPADLDERPARRDPPGVLVFLLGGAVAVALGLGALAIVRVVRKPDVLPPVVAPTPAGVEPRPQVPAPTVEPQPPPVHEPSVVAVPEVLPPDAAPELVVTPPVEPVAATPDAGTEPTVIAVPPETPPEPPPSHRPSGRHRDRGDRDRDHKPRIGSPPVIGEKPTPASTPPAVVPDDPPPEPTIPKSDLKDPFKKK